MPAIYECCQVVQWLCEQNVILLVSQWNVLVIPSVLALLYVLFSVIICIYRCIAV